MISIIDKCLLIQLLNSILVTFLSFLTSFFYFSTILPEPSRLKIERPFYKGFLFYFIYEDIVIDLLIFYQSICLGTWGIIFFLHSLLTST